MYLDIRWSAGTARVVTFEEPKDLERLRADYAYDDNCDLFEIEESDLDEALKCNGLKLVAKTPSAEIYVANVANNMGFEAFRELCVNDPRLPGVCERKGLALAEVQEEIRKLQVGHAAYVEAHDSAFDHPNRVRGGTEGDSTLTSPDATLVRGC